MVDLAAHYGWRAFFVEQSTREIVRRSGARIRVRNISRQGVGFPDLVLLRARDARLIFAELKRERDARHHSPDVAAAQKEWLEDLRAFAREVDRPLRSGIDPRNRIPIYPLHPPVEVFVWRPSDYNTVEEVLR